MLEGNYTRAIIVGKYVIILNFCTLGLWPSNDLKPLSSDFEVIDDPDDLLYI